MTRLSALDWPTVEAAYDFTPYATIVDVGGGHGQLLARMLAAAPAAKGVLVERESVIGGAEQHLREAGVLSRCRLEAGSFFDTAPDDGDLYVLRRATSRTSPSRSTSTCWSSSAVVSARSASSRHCSSGPASG